MTNCQASRQLEKRLRNLRQVYALAFLLNQGRQKELADAIRGNPEADIEHQLLAKDEWLHIQAAGPGSFLATVLSKVRGAGQKSLYAVGVLFSEGRDLLIDNLRTGNAIKKEELRKNQIANDKAAADAAFDIYKKLNSIKNPKDREEAKHFLLSNTRPLNPKIAGLLPPPDDPNN
jgi:hypothetical protein